MPLSVVRAEGSGLPGRARVRAVVPPGRASLLACTLTVVLVAAAISAPAALAWKPEKPRYGIGVRRNLAVKMSDGVILRANVYYPTDPKTGKEASGTFPVILTQTPYGKDDAKYAGSSSVSQLSGYNPYLIKRGYIDVLADVRGTGGSTGQWGLFDPVQGHDGATLVNWAATLPHSDGKVGLYGASYMGIDQFATAADAGPKHVKAMFPIIAGNEIYRDTASAGGFPDVEFGAFYLGMTGVLNILLPFEEQNPNLPTALADHVHDLQTFDLALIQSDESGGPRAYDEGYWQARSPVYQIQKIVRDHIPAFLIGGWYDLFQRGELLNYSGFQNASDHRPVLAPMRANQQVTSRYQLIQGSWFHVTAGQGLNYHGLNMNGVALAWFDRWLKGIDTGITQTKTPLHLEDLSNGHWYDASRYPLNQARPATYYLQPGNALAATKPNKPSSPDTLVFTGLEVPCSQAAEQWGAGLGQLVLSYFGITDPCVSNDHVSLLGPGIQSYTSAPFKKATTLAGPIGATLYATSTSSDSEWVVQLYDVAPDGSARSLTQGVLEGNQRALNRSLTWYAKGGRPLLPYHPYTKSAQQPAKAGQVTRYDIEIFPTFDTLAPGHRLRVAISTAEFPHALPSIAQTPGLLLGIYGLEHAPAYASSLELPLISGTRGLAPISGGPLP
jgi:putative CocE/NonD family hydrolase